MSPLLRGGKNKNARLCRAYPPEIQLNVPRRGREKNPPNNCPQGGCTPLSAYFAFFRKLKNAAWRGLDPRGRASPPPASGSPLLNRLIAKWWGTEFG